MKAFRLILVVCRGEVAGSNTPEAADRLAVLKHEVAKLDEYEKLIDLHKSVRRKA